MVIKILYKTKAYTEYRFNKKIQKNIMERIESLSKSKLRLQYKKFLVKKSDKIIKEKDIISYSS